jgi:WNK lysine deficient protein kinase
MEHPFLAVEPEVVLLTTSENKNHLTMQVVFKGMDKLSVKFEYNIDSDTAEEVVNEMVLFLIRGLMFIRSKSKSYLRNTNSL